MPHILKNKNLEIHIDLPFENYNFSRFDWTGKIAKVLFHGIPVSGIEKIGIGLENKFGQGFYNEFGIDTALGFEEAGIGSWFHKIGIGLLRKDEDNYLFNREYEIKPARFQVDHGSDRSNIVCIPDKFNGYSYLLKKEIEILDSGFTIHYLLENTGEKDIITSEYVHNFMAIDNELIGQNYVLKFPFRLKPEFFGEIVNPEEKVDIRLDEIRFKGSHDEQFFFSNLAGGVNAESWWELINTNSNIGIRESGSFLTDKVNLWGWKHVVSPELFLNVAIQPGQMSEWSRTYRMFRVRP